MAETRDGIAGRLRRHVEFLRGRLYDSALNDMEAAARALEQNSAPHAIPDELSPPCDRSEVQADPGAQQGEHGGAAHRELGWLVENGRQGDALRYRTMDQGLAVWTADHMRAIRFARRVDAELFAQEDDEAWRIAEHEWISATDTNAAGRTPCTYDEGNPEPEPTRQQLHTPPSGIDAPAHRGRLGEADQLVPAQSVPAAPVTGETFQPCGHEPPQSAAQLHGVCIFCYRDRLGAHVKARSAAEQRAEEVETAWANALRKFEAAADRVAVLDALPRGLQISIALRLDHALNSRMNFRPIADAGETDEQFAARRLRVMTDALRAWEEISGRGYWSPSNNSSYEEHFDAASAAVEPR